MFARCFPTECFLQQIPGEILSNLNCFFFAIFFSPSPGLFPGDQFPDGFFSLYFIFGCISLTDGDFIREIEIIDRTAPISGTPSNLLPPPAERC